MPDRLIVFGSGGHAKVVVEACLAKAPAREIILLDDAKDQGRVIFNFAVSGGRDRLESLRGTPVALAIGDNKARSELMAWLMSQGHSLESVIHPAATVGRSVTIGEGVFVGAGAIAIADALIGPGAIINTGASVDHDCEIGEAAHIAPGVRLCGNVRIGPRALLGVGCVVKPGISVAADVVVGAGAVVVRDLTEPCTYVGNPAQKLAPR